MATRISHLSDETRDQLAELAMTLSGHKETRPAFLGLIKKAAPATPIPELDTAAALDTRLGAEREAREKFEKEQRDRWFAEDLAKTKASAASKYGLSEEDMAKMEEMMKKGELPADYRFAPQLFKAQMDAATPTNYGHSGYGPLDIEGTHSGEQFKGLMESPENWSVTTAHSMIDEMRKGRAAS